MSYRIATYVGHGPNGRKVNVSLEECIDRDADSWSILKMYTGPVQWQQMFKDLLKLWSAEEATGLRVHDGHSPIYIMAVARGEIKL